MGCQGKRSGLTAHGGVVHLPMPCQSFLLLHRFLFLLSFLLLSFQDLTIEGLFASNRGHFIMTHFLNSAYERADRSEKALELGCVAKKI